MTDSSEYTVEAGMGSKLFIVMAAFLAISLGVYQWMYGSLFKSEPEPTCVEVTGVWTGTLAFQSSIGKQAYLPIMVKDRKNGNVANATAVNGVWEVPSYVEKQKADFRVAFTAETSAGEAHVRLEKCEIIDTEAKAKK